MPTWAEIKAHVREKYTLQEDDEKHFKLVWEYRNNRFQMITVSHFEAVGKEWVDFASAACRRDQMPPEVALERNFGFALGALCLDGDVYVVRYSALLESMDLDELEIPLHVVAQTADELEQEFAETDSF